MCIPRPMNAAFSIEPPQLDPVMRTSTGSGQNSGCPQINADPSLSHHQRVSPVLRHHFNLGLVGQIPQIHSALDFAADDVAVDSVAQVLVRLKHPETILTPRTLLGRAYWQSANVSRLQ